MFRRRRLPKKWAITYTLPRSLWHSWPDVLREAGIEIRVVVDVEGTDPEGPDWVRHIGITAHSGDMKVELTSGWAGGRQSCMLALLIIPLAGNVPLARQVHRILIDSGAEEDSDDFKQLEDRFVAHRSMEGGTDEA